MSLSLHQELKKYSSVDDRLELKDLEEFFRFLFERMGIYFRKEETKVLANRLDDCLKPMNCEKVVDFIVEEADRQEFTILSLKLRKIAEKAYMDGEDIEQMLSSYDKSGIHFIAIKDFQLFLNGMSKYGRLSARDISLCCKHFSRKGNDTDRPPISLREVMAFFGKDYVGNIAVRLRKILDRRLSIIDCPRNLFIALQEHSSHRSVRLTYEELEDFLGKQGVYDDLSHDQVRKAIVNMDMSRCGEVSGQQMLNYLNVPFSSTDIESSKVRLDSIPQTEVTTEALLRILLEKVQTNGGAVDATFRHFDANGDGSISKKELVSGLSNLKIFDHIPDWKKQIPELVKKFDSSEDGLVSLKEFFAFLGINDYAPNIIQRMTKIFAVATQKGLSIKDIFVELDSDGSGELDQTELISGLKKLGTFGEISNDDAAAVIEVFDVDGDKKISLTEFVDFFSARVEQVLKERREKQAEALAKRFRSVMQAAQRQGVSARDIFYHFDKDKGGTLSTKELADGLTALPNFKALSNRDINDLVGILDSDGNGDVSVDEFESFVNDEMENCSSRPVTLLERVQNMFKTAEAKGLTFQKAFSLIDTDKNGQLSLKELETCLLKLPSFNALDTKEIKQLFDTIDIDGSGLISIDEFKKYVLEGKTVTERRRAAQIDTGKNVERKPEISDSKESFIRHLQRIAEIDGSITRLLAYLDDDEDGLISTAMLKTLLRRENVFDTLSEDIVDSLLQPMLTADNQIKVSVLLRYVEGRESQEVISIEYKDSEPEQDYEFSHDPEIKAIEKKIRSFGRFLASKGVNVESLFQNYDTKSSGVVRRTEFVEILSQLGMHLLEQGKVFEQAHGIETDSRKMQIKQINRIKGNESSFASYAPRMARKMLMSGGEQKDGEFKVLEINLFACFLHIHFDNFSAGSP